MNSLEKVNKWKQKLLDLGKRNRLLFFRPTKRTTLQLIDPDYTNIFRRLVNEGRPLEFIMDNQKRFDLDREEDDLEATTEEPSERVVIKSGQVLADQTGSNLEKSLYQIRSRARTAVEEQGVTILFVAFGFLEWTEVDASQEIIRSPLVMVPVELQQDSILEPYRLVPVDDDVVLNPTLVHKLELDFGIELPGLPEDGDWELDDLLDRIEEVVSKRGWRVAREVYLSLFSFLKLNMYKDLERNAEAMVEHPLIAAIAGDTSKMSPLPDDLINDGDLDRRIQPHDTYQVWDADSSQQEAILAAKQGVSFVLQGPPGTGKSQTITNIIAECLAAGKRVLFVSEKMAALEVVYRRLKEAGLEDFCLQLHSHKANKKEVVNELGRTLLADKIQVVCGALEQLDNLVSQREKLNAFVNALHTVRQPLGRSVYQIHGEVAKLEKAPDVIFSFEQAGSCGPSDLRRFENLLNQFAGTVRRVGSEYFANPWNGCIIPAYTLKLQHDINTRFGKLSGLLTRLEELLDDIADRLSLFRPQSLQEMERIATILALVGKSPQPPIEWLLSDTLEPLLQQASAYKESQMEWQSLRSRLLRRYQASIFSADAEALIDALTTGVSRALKMFKASYISGPEGLLEQREQLMPFLRQAAAAIKNMLQAGAELSRILGIEPPQTTAACRRMATLAKEVAIDPRPVSSWFDLGQHRMILGVAKEARENFERLHSVETALFARYDREVLSLEVPSMLQRFRTDYSGLFRYLKAGYYRDMKILRSYLKNPAGFTYQQALSDLQLMKEALDQRSWIANNELQMANSFGTWYLGDQTDWDALDSALLCVGEIISHFRPDTVPANLQNLLVSSGAPVGQVAVQLENLKRALDEVTPLLKVVCEQSQMDEGVISSETIEEIALPIIQAWAEAAESALNPVFQAYDAVRAHLKGDGNLLLSEALEDLHAVNRVNTIETDLEAHLDDLRTAFGRFYRGVETEWSAVISALDWASQVRALFLPGRPPEGFARPICTDKEVIQLARDTAKTCAKLLEAAKEKAAFAASLFEPGQVDLIQMQVPSVKQWLQVRLENLAALEDWIDFRQSREQCRAAGLEPFVNAVLESRVPPESIKAAFFKRFYRLWLDYIYSQVPELQEFRGRRHEEIIEDFRQLDKAQFRIAQSRLRAKLSEQRPNPYLMTARGSEVSILLGETEKRRKLKPLRKLFQEIPNLLLTLKPCLLMSPLSVSQYLDPNLYQFDTVIFDEASQICTEDAIGAIFRGRQLIVVGDREQLPPTNFFSVSVGEGEFADEDDDTEAYESILDVCSSVLHRKSLRWHYRSRHEHLIAFSNAHIYKNLITFPGPVDRAPGLGVEFIHVPSGVYDRAGTKANKIEAQRVAELIFEHFREYPDRSLGVVTFSEAQQSAVDAAIRQLRLKYPEFEPFFRDDRQEPFFVKNLENVQGDERDTIIFSVGYARDQNGVMHMNFGPLNKQGGYRRLNVAITRARYNVKLVSSIKPTDIDLDRTNSYGVKMLRQYMEFAIDGPQAMYRQLQASSIPEFDSPFEEAVYKELLHLGFQVDTQVGCSGYRIDLAIRHPELPGHYLLGIECDGRTYHSARTARDRDRLREEVLKELGWQLHRIWSTDWIKDPQAEITRLLQAVERAKASYSYSGIKPVTLPEETASEVKIPIEVTISPEDAAKVLETLPGTREYVKADIRAVERNPDQPSLDYLVAVTAHVVTVEGPIHQDVLARRLAPLFGQERASRKVKQIIEWVVENDSENRFKKQGDFIWPSDMEVPPVRVPPKGKKPRPILHICVEERAEAVMIVLQSAMGMSLDNLVVETAKLLGFNRTSDHIREALLDAIALLEEARRVELQDGIVRPVRNGDRA